MFGILKRGGRVYALPVADASSKTLLTSSITVSTAARHPYPREAITSTERVLRKYDGIPGKHFLLFLKQCEFRFNYGSPRQQLATLRSWMGI